MDLIVFKGLNLHPIIQKTSSYPPGACLVSFLTFFYKLERRFLSPLLTIIYKILSKKSFFFGTKITFLLFCRVISYL